nr:hypothetical protein [uncultured Oscillibacter sp.]
MAIFVHNISFFWRRRRACSLILQKFHQDFTKAAPRAFEGGRVRPAAAVLPAEVSKDVSVISAKKAEKPLAKSEKIKYSPEKPLIFGRNDAIFMCGENDCVHRVLSVCL